MIDVVMPQMGESIVEGTLTKWLKKAGERVERDESLFEISTDKVDAEIPAPASGVLQEIRVEPGTTVLMTSPFQSTWNAFVMALVPPRMAKSNDRS